LVVRKTALTPVLREGAQFDFTKLTADAVFVVDVASREVLLARNSRDVRTMASITKLMTAAVALDHDLSFAGKVTMAKEDDVGGARLQAAAGTRLSTADLFYAMLVGSANNAANAVARSTGLSTADFVAAMNDKAAAIGLVSTHFVDTSGMDPANVSTAEEIGALALEVFEKYYYIRRSASTAKYTMVLAGQKHTIKNTNELLTDDNNGLIVTGGKTGYLEESQWNLAVKMMDYRGKTIVVVVLGSDSKQDVFRDASTAGKWVWNNYRWIQR
jgi:D-alanyl-D-alanine endopeptidase (penicillin-binding protein 7)